MWWWIVLGVIFIIYGTLKFIFCCLELLPINYKSPAIKKILSTDKTFAGKFMYAILLLFSCLTLIKGLSWTGIIEYHVGIETYIWMNLTFGCILSIFYYFAAYTNVPIDKLSNSKDTYIGVGLCSGLTFLITIPVMVFIYMFIKHNYSMKKHLMTPQAVAIFMGTLVLGYIDLKLFLSSGVIDNIKHNIDLLMISLNSIV